VSFRGGRPATAAAAPLPFAPLCSALALTPSQTPHNTPNQNNHSDAGAVDILIHQLHHRNALAPQLLGPCVSVCLGGLSSLAAVSACAKQLMVARGLPEFLMRVIQAADSAIAASNAEGDAVAASGPPAGAAAAELLAAMQRHEGGSAGGAAPMLSAAARPASSHLHRSMPGAGSLAAAFSSSPRTPYSSPFAPARRSMPGFASPETGPMFATRQSAGGCSVGPDGGLLWPTPSGLPDQDTAAAIERRVAELATRIKAATLADPRTQSPRHALDAKLMGGRWAALGAALGMGDGYTAANIAVVSGGLLGTARDAAAVSPLSVHLSGLGGVAGTTPFNSPCVLGGGTPTAAGGAGFIGAAAAAARLQVSASGAGARSSLISSSGGSSCTVQHAGALGSTGLTATPFNSPLRSSVGLARTPIGGTNVSSSSAANNTSRALQRLVHEQAIAAGASLITPFNSPVRGRYAGRPLSSAGIAPLPPVEPLRLSMGGGGGSVSPGRRGPSSPGAYTASLAATAHSSALDVILNSAAAASGRVAAIPNRVRPWGSAADLVHPQRQAVGNLASISSSNLGIFNSGGSGGGSLNVAAEASSLTAAKQPAAWQQVAWQRPASSAGGVLPHRDSLVCPSLLSPFGGSLGESQQPQHASEGSPIQLQAGAQHPHSPNARSIIAADVVPCSRCGHWMSSCCGCSAVARASASPGDEAAAVARTASGGVALHLSSTPMSSGRPLVSAAEVVVTEAGSTSSLSEAEQLPEATGYRGVQQQDAPERQASAAIASAVAAHRTFSHAEEVNWAEAEQATADKEGEASYPAIRILAPPAVVMGAGGAAALLAGQKLASFGSGSGNYRYAQLEGAAVASDSWKAVGDDERVGEAAAAADYDLSAALDLQDLAARLEAADWRDNSLEAAPDGKRVASSSSASSKQGGGAAAGQQRRRVGAAAAMSEEAVGDGAAEMYPAVFM